MNKKRLVLCLLLFAFLTAIAGCGSSPGTGTQGIHWSSGKDMDFSIEVSGRLSEEPRDPGVEAKPVIALNTVADGQYSDKVLRWGIARKTGNRTPDADPGTPALLEKYGGIYLGDTSKKEIYLTFDEGYENGYTTKILDALKENKARGVFFITGPYLKEHPDLVKRMVDEGHVVGNHTINHPSLPDLSDKALEEEIVGLDKAFYEKFGQHMKYLRPPKGEYSERTLAVTQRMGYRNMFWSFAYDDWYRDRIRGGDYAYEIVMRNLHNGAVLLLHAVSKDNADALDRIIKGAREQGYEIGDVDNIR